MLVTGYSKRCPLKRIDTILDIQGSLVETSIATAECRAVIRPKEDFKDIIRFYDEEIEYLHSRIVATKNEIEKKINIVDHKNEGANISLSNKIIKTNKLISDSTVSSIGSDLYGVITIITGLIFATIPELIVKIF